MEVVSLIIMVLGLVALVGIFLLSRASQKDSAPKRDLPINKVLDEAGNERSSIADDQPARDGKIPNGKAFDLDGEELGDAPPQPSFDLPPQLILFIAAEEGHTFSGDAVLDALESAGLVHGDMGLFHRMILAGEGEISLFSVANGIEPWTLNPEDLQGKSTPGFSLILNLPAPIDNSEAIHDFIRTADRIHAKVGGVIKDHNQQPFTPEVRDEVLRFLAPDIQI